MPQNRASGQIRERVFACFMIYSKNQSHVWIWCVLFGGGFGYNCSQNEGLNKRCIPSSKSWFIPLHQRNKWANKQKRYSSEGSDDERENLYPKHELWLR